MHSSARGTLRNHSPGVAKRFPVKGGGDGGIFGQSIPLPLPPTFGLLWWPQLRGILWALSSWNPKASFDSFGRRSCGANKNETSPLMANKRKILTVQLLFLCLWGWTQKYKKVDVSLRDVVRDFYSILRPIVCRDDFFVGNSVLRWGRCCVCYPDKGCERGSVPAGYGQALLKLRLATKNIAILQKKNLWAMPKGCLLYISFL